MSEGLGAWQPIETAPYDEDVLLAYRFSLGHAIAYKTEEGRWISLEGSDWGDGKVRFSHWMPLPAPPVSV